MHGVKRVLIFCTLIVILPATLIIIPLYLRKTIFADVTYPVAESDIIEIRDGISTVFCQQHSLRMSSSFNAFQLRSKPEVSSNRKHIRLKKSMTLPDDTLEYWGFYLLKGALVHLKFCSRYDGSRILVVKGQRDLRTCGLLDHNKNKVDANFAQGHEQVKVFFEDITEFADHVPAETVQRKALSQRKEDDNDMESENDASEDLSDVDGISAAYDSNANASILLTTAAPQQTTKQPRKKLKKDSPNFISNDKTEAPKDTASSATAETGGKRQRRHNTPQIPTNTKSPRKARYAKDHASRKQRVYDQLYKRRSKREHVYDRKYSHGGNAVNFTDTDESNSISSFENGLFDCYNGAILLAEGFPPSADCVNAHFLENGSHRMLSKHEITEDGYYYYIFYSDNDLVRNDIHAIFDIYKPTFQYSNLTDAQGCVNATDCTFSIGFLSDDIVVVEVPTRDGIEHEEDDITYLISTCHPRTAVYAIFPISVLVLILSCSFL